jgi:hypothetical protein
MQEKIIEIPFNHQRFIETQKHIWNFSSRKFIKSNLTYIILAVICLTIGLNLKERDSFLIIFSGGYLVYISLSWIGLFERRIKFFKKTKQIAQLFEEESMDCLYVFSDTGLQYDDKEKTLRFAWFLFNPFVIYKENMILTLKGSKEIIFIISKEELNQNYPEIYNILKEKISEEVIK